jgi:uncharacterized membrane protein YfhO
VSIEVDAPAPAVVVVKNSYDPHWHAEVDGRPTAVLPADYLMQGIPIPAGRHTVTLTYRDSSLGYGVLASALAISGLLVSSLWPAGWGRRRRLLSERRRPA